MGPGGVRAAGSDGAAEPSPLRGLPGEPGVLRVRADRPAAGAGDPASHAARGGEGPQPGLRHPPSDAHGGRAGEDGRKADPEVRALELGAHLALLCRGSLRRSRRDLNAVAGRHAPWIGEEPRSSRNQLARKLWKPSVTLAVASVLMSPLRQFWCRPISMQRHSSIELQKWSCNG